MLPIRFASFGLARRLGFWSVLILFGGVVLGSAEARPLDQPGIEEFRALIDPKREPRLEASAVGTATSLAEYRRKIRLATARLPSLGEVTRVLLLPEWRSADDDRESPVPLAQVKKAVAKGDERSFQQEVEKLLRMKPDYPADVQRIIIVEIKRDVRARLLQRLDDRLRHYLRDGRAEDRIAAANLIGDTVATARRQESYDLMAPEVTKTSSSRLSGHYLSRRLSELAGDLRTLIQNGNPQVQAAGVRALSELEIDPAVNLAAFTPLLASPQNNVVVRRAAAAALAQMLEVKSSQMNKSRPQPIVEAVEQVLAVAVRGLADADADVRRASLAACQRAALIVDDMASDPQTPLDRRAAFRSALAAVDRALPALNRCARDSEPALRVLACRTLETMVLASQKVRHLNEQPLPPPLPEPSEPETTPPPSRDRKGAVSLPLPNGRGSVASASRPSPWATARLSEPRPLGSGADNRSLTVATPKDSVAPAVTLERPIKLSAAQPRLYTEGLRPAAFVARQIDELPSPAPVDAGLQGTLKAMIDDLSDPDYRVRLSAVDVLETLGERAEPAMPALIKRLDDSNKFIRWASARTLGRLAPRRAEEVVPRLSKLLDDHEDPSVRITAAFALEQYGPAAKGAVPLLARVINRGDKDYVIAILHAIQGIGTDAAAALPNVAWVLRDRSLPPSVRVEAAQTLGRFGDLAKNQLPSLRP